MLRQSSDPWLWFRERVPDFYFYLIGILSFVVIISSIAWFVKMNKQVFKIEKWKKVMLLLLGFGLLALLISEILYRIEAFSGINPYYTVYLWHYILFTSFLALLLVFTWIFKGIITKQFTYWKEEFFSFKIIGFLGKKSIYLKFMHQKYSQKSTIKKEHVSGKNDNNSIAPMTISVRKFTNIVSPVTGNIKLLDKVKDDVFSKKLMGNGVAIVPTSGNIYAPVSGIVETAFRTGHAYGIKNSEGLAILVHIGLNTVTLNGEGFTSLVKQGQNVSAGDLIAKVNLALLRKKKIILDTIVIILPESNVSSKILIKTGKVLKNTTIIKVS